MQNPNMQEPIVAALEPDITDRLISRREAISRGAAMSTAVAAGLAMASAPVAIAALARDAYGQTTIPGPVNLVLNFALVLEYLESEFYVTGVGKSGLIPSADRAIFTTIRDHEVAHVDFLKSTLGSRARPKPSFDFTAGGAYADVFSNYATFKAVAQAFEDTGVRAYKGQAPTLRPYDAYLTAALTIHSVEARHASEIRRLRGNFAETEPYYEGWITGSQTDVPGAAAVYAGEANTVQGGVDVTTLVSGIATNEVTEAFDEPLTMSQVLSIVGPFLA